MRSASAAARGVRCSADTPTGFARVRTGVGLTGAIAAELRPPEIRLEDCDLSCRRDGVSSVAKGEWSKRPRLMRLARGRDDSVIATGSIVAGGFGEVDAETLRAQVRVRWKRSSSV